MRRSFLAVAVVPALAFAVVTFAQTKEAAAGPTLDLNLNLGTALNEANQRHRDRLLARRRRGAWATATTSTARPCTSSPRSRGQYMRFGFNSEPGRIRLRRRAERRPQVRLRRHRAAERLRPPRRRLPRLPARRERRPAASSAPRSTSASASTSRSSPASRSARRSRTTPSSSRRQFSRVSTPPSGSTSASRRASIFGARRVAASSTSGGTTDRGAGLRAGRPSAPRTAGRRAPAQQVERDHGADRAHLLALAWPAEPPHHRPSGAASATKTSPTGFSGVPPPGPAIPVIATAYVVPARRARALGHRARARLAHGAVLAQELLAHAEQLHLRLVRVGDEAAVEVLRRAGDAVIICATRARRCSSRPWRASPWRGGATSPTTSSIAGPSEKMRAEARRTSADAASRAPRAASDVGALDGELHLDLGEVRAEAELHPGEALLELREHLVRRRLGEAEAAQDADVEDRGLGAEPLEARDDLLGEHALHLARDAGHEEEVGAADARREAGRGADGVRAPRRAPGSSPACGCSRASSVRARLQRPSMYASAVSSSLSGDAEDLGGDLGGEIVDGRPEAARAEDHVGRAAELAEGGLEHGAIVADGRVAGDLEAERRPC